MPLGVSAYTALANVTLGSAAASVTFSSISQAYRDLVLICSVQSVTSSNFMIARFNNNSGSVYPNVVMTGNGTSALSEQGTNTRLFISKDSMPTSTSFAISTTNILDYSVTDKHKSILIREDIATMTSANAARFADTSAITSILLFTTAGNLAAGSTLSLYGIAS